MLKRLPNTIYVSIQGEGSGRYLQANTDAINALEDDGPTKVGTYRLVHTEELKKQIIVVGKNRRRS